MEMEKEKEKKKKGEDLRRMVLSDESLNGRGFRVLTGGIRLDRYAKNPVLLWMHRRGEVMGVVEDLRVEAGKLTGMPKFDCLTEQSRLLKAQYEAGSVRACSMGIDIYRVETELKPDGEERPIVTDCELYEVSMVDVPENENSVQLRHLGKVIDASGLVALSHGGEAGVRPAAKPPGTVAGAPGTVAEMPGTVAEMLGTVAGAATELAGAPMTRATTARAAAGALHAENKGELVNRNTNLKKTGMTLSEMAVLLGLDAGASEEAVRTKAQELAGVRAELAKTAAELQKLKEAAASAELAHVERLVDAAVSDMRITADKKPRYVELGKQIGSASLEAVLGDLKPVGRLVETLQHGGGGGNGGNGAWKKLSDVPPSELTTLKKNDRGLYARLYKAEYGVELGDEAEQ